MSTANALASPIAYRTMERSAATEPRPTALPHTGFTWLCPPLAFCPRVRVAKDVLSRRKDLVVFAAVSLLYIGGITCFTVSSSVHDSIFLTAEGDPVTNPWFIFLLAWALYVTNPWVTAFVDLCIWIRWALLGLDDDDSSREYVASNASVALVILHLLCHLVLFVMMVTTSWKIKAKIRKPSCCEVCICGACFPVCWLAEAVSSKAKRELLVSHDELPAYHA